MATLPVDIDSTYADDGADASVQIHQSHHDTLHAQHNDFEGTTPATFATAAEGVLADAALQPGDIGTTVQAWAAVLDATTASFTTADETKLDGIETAATADQSAAEILAALLTVDGAGSGLDADLLDGTSSAGFATAAQGTLADSALQSADIGVTVQGHSAVLDATTASFLTADETKLDGIEALADVTDATNVAAAGAVMESDATTAAMSFVIDEDNMASNSATKVPTQQSVKAYADLKVPEATFPVCLGFAISDETTALTTGTAKLTVRSPYAFTLTDVRATLTTTSSSGIPTFDINEGTSVLSTKLTIDVGELTSETAATAAVISDSAIADDAVLTFDIDVAGTGAAGAKIWLYGTRDVA